MIEAIAKAIVSTATGAASYIDGELNVIFLQCRQCLHPVHPLIFYLWAFLSHPIINVLTDIACLSVSSYL